MPDTASGNYAGQHNGEWSTERSENIINVNIEEKFKRVAHLLSLLGTTLIHNSEINIVLGHKNRSKNIKADHFVILCFLQSWKQTRE